MPDIQIDSADKPPIWREKYRIRSYDVDTSKRATLMSLCRYFQESAGHHSQTAKLGYEHLVERGQFWVLSRFFLEIDRYPLWQEQVNIETWSKGPEGIFALRDFIFFDAENKVIARGTSGWLTLDTEKRRPQRLDYFAKLMPFIRDKHAVEHKLTKLQALEEPEIRAAYSVSFTDLDISNHVTGTRYMEWILNSFSFEYLTAHQIRSFEINFLTESLYGDEIIVLGEKSSRSRRDTPVAVKRKGDNRELCRARAIWE
jgi:medium-chain acyl-[acyl-carrier-protein] hydrolase